MKELTKEEFEDRLMAIQRARRIFIESGMTKNVSVAFEIYQEVFAERERQIFLTTQNGGDRPKTVMDKYERPKCPEDGFEMQFRPVPENAEGIKTQLVCSNPKHTGDGSVLHSEHDLAWWMQNLKIREENLQSNHEIHKLMYSN